jgi:hypothetical protein
MLPLRKFNRIATRWGNGSERLRVKSAPFIRAEAANSLENKNCFMGV